MGNDDALRDTISLLRSQMMLGWPAKSILRKHQFVDSSKVWACRNLLDQPYPKTLMREISDGSFNGINLVWFFHSIYKRNYQQRKSYPKSQIYWFSIDHHICGVIIENSRDILSGKCICGITDEKTSFTDSSARGKEEERLPLENCNIYQHNELNARFIPRTWFMVIELNWLRFRSSSTPNGSIQCCRFVNQLDAKHKLTHFRTVWFIYSSTLTHHQQLHI